MFLKEIWRYPVKSMAGEKIESASLTVEGIAGDRIVQARGQRGGFVTSRTKPGLLGHKGSTAPDGSVLVDGQQWRDPQVARNVELAAGPGVTLGQYDGPERFDILPLLVGTDGAYQHLGLDYRRFRPNLVIGGVEGLAERSWEGKRLRIGTTVIAMADLRGRCVMTTYDPDTLQQDLNVLRKVAREFDGTFNLNTAVHTPGTIHVGDEVELLA